MNDTETLVHSFVSTRLDYCNLLCLRLLRKQMKRLQGIQNNAACLDMNTGKYGHTIPILESFHWLPVDQLILYKVLLITYKCLCGLASPCLKDLLTIKTNRGLPSDYKVLVLVPRSNVMSYGDRAFYLMSYGDRAFYLMSYGDRAFYVVSLLFWKSLLSHIRLCPTVDQFKSQLKTYLSKKSVICKLNASLVLTNCIMSNVYLPICSQECYQFLMCYFNVFSASENHRTGIIQMCHYHYHSKQFVIKLNTSF